jgi:hypothetical protein
MITWVQPSVMSFLYTLNGETFIIHNIIIVHVVDYRSKEELTT